jgi:uncharacterized protein GlcG (DUF336 family)
MKLASSLSLATAEAIIDAAFAIGASEGMKPLSVIVLDSGGRMVALKSQDGSGIMRVDIAMGKAWGALGMGMPSRMIRDYLSERPNFQTALAVTSQGRFVPVPGGVLIEDAGGMIIGAVGISGDASDKDEYCAICGIKAVGFTPSPQEPDPDWRRASLSDHR